MKNGNLHPRLLFARLLILAVQNNILTAQQLQYVAKTVAVLLVVQGCPLSFNSLVETQRACTAADEFNTRTPGCLPMFLHDLVIIPTPKSNLELRSTSIWGNHPHLQAMQLRVPTSIELLKGVVQFSNRVLPRFRLYNHTLLLKTLADAIFQLELVGDYIRLLPLPRVPQTFPDIQHAPGTPPMDAGHPLHSRTT